MKEDYQLVFIFLLSLNLLFWVIVACWRFCTVVTITRPFNFNRSVVGVFQNIRYYIQRRFFSRRSEQPTNLPNLRGITNRNLNLNSDLPPSYEEALKYPCVSTICRSINMNNDLNLFNNNLSTTIEQLDSLNLLNEFESQNSVQENYENCNGNCLNHLKKNENNSIDNTNNSNSNNISKNSSGNTSPNSSYEATTSTILIDENSTSSKIQDIEIKIDLNLKEDKMKQSIKEIHEKLANKSFKLVNINNLNENKNENQLVRSSTFNDLQTCLKNYTKN